MQLEVLRRIVQEVDNAPTLHDALELMVKHVALAMDSEVCTVYLLNERQNRFVLFASQGLNSNAIGLSLAMGEGLVGQVGLCREIVSTEQASSHPNYYYLPETGEERYNAFLGVPIMYRRQVMGVMVVQHTEREAYTAEEESFMVTLCAQLSGAIAHAQAVEQNDLFARPGMLPSQKTFNGISGAGGIAIGRAVVYLQGVDLDLVPDRFIENVAEESALLLQAVEAVRYEITHLDQKMQGVLMDEERALFMVYLSMLDAHALPAQMIAYIEQESCWAQTAVRKVISDHSAHFAMMEDVYLREREADIKDLGHRILAKLQAADHHSLDFAENTILLSDELSTTSLVELPLDNIAAIVTTKGSTNSHMAIVARALAIPTVVGVTDLPLTQLDDAEMVVDGHLGRVFVNPVRNLRLRYKEIQKEEAQAAKELDQYANKATLTQDGTAISLLVNTGMMIDVIRGVQRGSDGVGLYRTEILFMLRERLPSEDEQRKVYREQLSHFAGKNVVMRTLDIGADKSLPYFPISEENPALGWRGVRISLDHPEIFAAQIRAMLRASIGLDNLSILLPMVSAVHELLDAKALIVREVAAIREKYGEPVAMPPIGVMLEVPAVLYQLDDFAAHVDFFSVGSNDLTQYLLAVDRSNTKVAQLYSHMHPAVLRALNLIKQRCSSLGKTVSVCGEMAGDTASALLLVGMGYTQLSMSASNLLKVRQLLAHVNLADVKALSAQCLQAANANDVLALLEQFVELHSLQKMIKPKREVVA